MTRILGIDPGSQRTGVGIIDSDGAGQARHVFHTALQLTAAADFPLRLLEDAKRSWLCLLPKDLFIRPELCRETPWR